MGLRGLGNVEFKRDARDGRLKLIECNHRFTAATGLLRAAGADLPLFVYNRLLERPLPQIEGYRTGLTMWYPMRDLRAFLAYRRQGELSTFAWLRSIIGRHHYPVTSASDPRPALVNQLRLLPPDQAAAPPPPRPPRAAELAGLRNEDPLLHERVAVGVVDRDLAQGPDRALASPSRPRGQGRRRSCREQAGAADRGVRGLRAGDREAVGDVGDGAGARDRRDAGC